MSDITNDIAPLGGLIYINGLVLQIVYPNATGAYRMYNGMTDRYRIEPALRTTITRAGIEPLDIGRTAPAIDSGPHFAPNNATARWGNNAMVDAANAVRAQYGIFIRNIGMDLTSIRDRPQNLIEGTRVDLSYDTFSLSQGRTIHVDEVKAVANLTQARYGDQVARQGDVIATINARSGAMRELGAGLKTAGKFLGPAGMAYDLVSTGVKIGADIAKNDGVGAGREAAQLVGRIGAEGVIRHLNPNNR
jgi:hypothetical protein